MALLQDSGGDAEGPDLHYVALIKGLRVSKTCLSPVHAVMCWAHAVHAQAASDNGVKHCIADTHVSYIHEQVRHHSCLCKTLKC